jgi:hypothetical protein
MTYELAKKLKDAGFPQDKKEGKFIDDIGNYDEMGMYKIIYIPTLSELIEECAVSGCKEIMITNETYSCNGWEAWGNKKDSFGARMGERGADIEVSGDTPEEAVANLWLKLNKKNL